MNSSPADGMQTCWPATHHTNPPESVTVIQFSRAVANAHTAAPSAELHIRTTKADDNFHQNAFQCDKHFTEQICLDPDFTVIANIDANHCPTRRFLSAGVAVTWISDTDLLSPQQLSAEERSAVNMATAICHEFPRSGCFPCWTDDPATLDRGRQFMLNACLPHNDSINVALVAEALGFGRDIQNNLFDVTNFRILCRLMSAHRKITENQTTVEAETMALNHYIMEVKASHPYSR